MTDYWQYNFPPFFTIQPNDETRRHQMSAWSAIILDYCRKNKIFLLNITDSLTRPPFRNEKISRSLTEEALYKILDEMAKEQRIEFIESSGPLQNNQSKQCMIYWLTIQEWSQEILKWVDECSLRGSMCTLYEIVGDEDKSNPTLLGLNERILMKALRLLEKQGKAVLVKADDSYGVKFL